MLQLQRVSNISLLVLDLLWNSLPADVMHTVCNFGDQGHLTEGC